MVEVEAELARDVAEWLDRAQQEYPELPDLPAATALGYRHAHRRLVHVQSDKGDIVHQARLPCVRLCTGHPAQPSTTVHDEDGPPITQRTSGLEPVESRVLLGTVDQVVRESHGIVEVVINYGGFLGIGTRLIAVPVHAMVLLGEDTEVVAFSPKQLQAFPTFATDDATHFPQTQSSKSVWPNPHTE